MLSGRGDLNLETCVVQDLEPLVVRAKGGKGRGREKGEQRQREEKQREERGQVERGSERSGCKMERERDQGDRSLVTGGRGNARSRGNKQSESNTKRAAPEFPSHYQGSLSPRLLHI